MTEEEAAKRYPERERLETTEETRTVYEDVHSSRQLVFGVEISRLTVEFSDLPGLECESRMGLTRARSAANDLQPREPALREGSINVGSQEYLGRSQEAWCSDECGRGMPATGSLQR